MPESEIQSLINLHMAEDHQALLRLCRDMDARSHWHPYQAMMMAEAGAWSNDLAAFDRGLALIRMFQDQAPDAVPVMQEFVRTLAMPKVIKAFGQGEYELVLRYLAIARLLDPLLADAFPDQGVTGKETVDAQIAAGRARPIPMQAQAEVPSLRAPSIRQRVLIFMRKFYFGPDSRPHEMFARFERGFQAAGWQAKSVDPSFGSMDGTGAPIGLTPNSNDLFDHTLAMDPDLVVIDFWGIVFAPGALVDYLAQMRRMRPETRLVLIHLDPWMTNSWEMTRSLAPFVDLFWCHSPRAPIWQAPDFAGKLFFQPFPMGIEIDRAARSQNAKSLFLGAVVHYNPSRAFWLAALHKANAPFDQQLSSHGHDGLDAETSFRAYLNRLADAGRSINFSMRETGYRQLTGRVFESIWVGACLIQEQSDEVEDYFIPGHHYLSFRTLPELIDILEFVARMPDAAARIGAAGHQFYLDHYSDDRLIAQLTQNLNPA